MEEKVVIFGGNHYIGLGAARCLGRNKLKVVAAMVDKQRKISYGFHSRYISEKLSLPDIKEEPEKLLQDLISYAKKQRNKLVLIPTADHHVEFLDKYMVELREHFLFPSIEQGLYTRLLDKDTLSELAEKHNVLIPKVITVSDDLNTAEVEKQIGYPCLVKPVVSHKFVAAFREKLFIANNEADIKHYLKKAKERGLEVFIQQLVSGFDDCMHTFDCYINKEGQITHWSTFQKQRQFPINFGASTYIKQLYVPELYEIGSKFLQEIGYRGFAEIEFKKDPSTGKFYLIEVNVRTTNFNILLDKLNINVPLTMYKELNGMEIGTKSIDKDTNMHFMSELEDIAAIRAYLKAKQLTLKQIMKSLMVKKVYAIWALDDPKPFFYSVYEKIKNKIVS